MGTAPFWLPPLLRTLLPLALSAWPASSAAPRAATATSSGSSAPRGTFSDGAGNFGDVEMRAPSASPRVDVQSPIHSAAHR
eukprot:gene20519-15052_t